VLEEESSWAEAREAENAARATREDEKYILKFNFGSVRIGREGLIFYSLFG